MVYVSGLGMLNFMLIEVPTESVPRGYDGEEYALKLPVEGSSAGSKGKPYCSTDRERTPTSRRKSRKMPFFIPVRLCCSIEYLSIEDNKSYSISKRKGKKSNGKYP
jgi:hypothetical protein